MKRWIERWNGLSAAPETLDAFVALYAADALHIAGPTPDQRGTATYRGHVGIRAMAARVAADQDHRTYRIESETARETTALLFHQTKGPWGGAAVAVQIIAVYTDHATSEALRRARCGVLPDSPTARCAVPGSISAKASVRRWKPNRPASAPERAGLCPG